jgi:hypothetical protein
MAVQGPNAIAPKRRWLRFRLRTLLLVVAVLGLLFGGLAAVPWVMWRYHVAQALEAARSAGPELSWSFGFIGASRRDDFLYLLSDRERVLDSLIQAVEHDPDDPRRIHAVQTMRAILKQPSPSDLRKRCLDRAVDLATRAGTSPAVEKELASAIDDWVSSDGLDSRQRGVILAKAKSSPPALLPAWASVLAEIGGREETVFLVSLGDTHDAALLNAVHNSSLLRSYWPGLLPALKHWLDDPVVAPHALRYSLLSQAPEGRNILLAYALSGTHPVELRRRAIERLQETIPGTNLLLNAVKVPGAREILSASIDGDLHATFQVALAKLEGRNGEALWSELIEGVDSGYPNRFPSPTTAIEKAVSEAESRIRQHTRESSLRCLRWITGRTDLQSQLEWRRWYEISRPSPLAQRDLVKLALEHPDALDTGAILRRIVPYRLGAVPAECVPLYERMAREGPPASRYWACTALLLCTPKTDAAPIVIDLIGERHSDDARTGKWGPIELLKERFAENYFWDLTAWREWWAEYGRKP